MVNDLEAAVVDNTVFVFGTGRSLLDLTTAQRKYLDAYPRTLAMNRYYLYYEKLGALACRPRCVSAVSSPTCKRFTMHWIVICTPRCAMREAFGLVCAEAALAGCPVIATRIDGLPKVVQHGRTGLCLAPERPAADLAELGTALEERVDYVYDPASDAIIEPRFIDPGHLADAIAELLGDEPRLSLFSRNAIDDAAGRLSYERYMRDLHAVFSENHELREPPS